jgi:diadenosine tetraphosphate (Ap4A) HIT family hydrolase
MISDEQIPEIKKQLIEQIDKTFPFDKKEMAKKQVRDMNKDQLISFLKENGMIKDEDSSCPMCLIKEGKIPSTKLDENEKAIAILEINPISFGHTIVLPKEHITKPEDLPKEVKELVEKVSQKLKKLNPKDILIKSSNVLGHEIINLIPVYTNETENSERKKVTPEELKKTLEEINEKETPVKEEVKKSACIFCSIGNKEIPSINLEENKYSIAVLEINPISIGHTIIIPKKHIKNSGEIPSQSLTLAKQIARKIKSKLKPKEVLIYTENKFDHEIINVLPIYNDETKNSEKIKITKEELEEIKSKLEKKQPKPKERKPTKKEGKQKEDLSKLPKFPTRIP